MAFDKWDGLRIDVRYYKRAFGFGRTIFEKMYASKPVGLGGKRFWTGDFGKAKIKRKSKFLKMRRAVLR